MFTPRTPNVRIDMPSDPGQIHRFHQAPLVPVPTQPAEQPEPQVPPQDPPVQPVKG
jgi:hypothetical protein